MATKLDKPVTRQLPLQGFDRGWRDITVTLHADHLEFRLKGLKRSYKVAMSHCLATATNGLPLNTREAE